MLLLLLFKNADEMNEHNVTGRAQSSGKEDGRGGARKKEKLQTKEAAGGAELP